MYVKMRLLFLCTNHLSVSCLEVWLTWVSFYPCFKKQINFLLYSFCFALIIVWRCYFCVTSRCLTNLTFGYVFLVRFSNGFCQSYNMFPRCPYWINVWIHVCSMFLALSYIWCLSLTKCESCLRLHSFWISVKKIPFRFCTFRCTFFPF